MSIGINTAAGEKLKAYADRIEATAPTHRRPQGQHLKDLKAEAKADGFNVQALQRLVAIRRNKRRMETEAELLNDLMLYMPTPPACPSTSSCRRSSSSPPLAEARLSPARDTVPFD